MRKDQNQMYNNIMKVAKRIVITILCCVPFMVLFGYYTRNIITASWAQVLIFTAFLLTVVLIEEVISRKREQKKQARELLDKTTDVFK